MTAIAPVADASVEVDVVIVTYNSAAYIARCLAAIERTTGSLASVTVADNGSVDGTPELVERVCPRAAVVLMGANTGFARANNRGFTAGSAPYVLLLNPDTEVDSTAIGVLVSFAKAHPRAGVVAPRLANADGTDQCTARAFPTPAAAIWGRRSPLTKWFPRNRWSAHYLVGASAPGSAAFQVDWVSGAAMLVPRTVIAAVGGLDEGFFLFWEDADWCRRIKAAGFEVWCVPTANVTHDEGGSREHGWPPPAIISFHRGAYRYWRKHHASQPWNPARWFAAAALACRAALLIGRARLLTGRHRAGVAARRTTDARDSE